MLCLGGLDRVLAGLQLWRFCDIWYALFTFRYRL